MRILLLDRLNADVLDNVLANHVIYRPDVLRKGMETLKRVVIENKIDAIVTSSEIPTTFLSRWTELQSSLKYLVHVEINSNSEATKASMPELLNEVEGRGFIILQARGNNETVAYTHAFTLLEHAFTYCELKQFLPTHNSVSGSNKRKRVLIIGSGIVNIITAYELQQAGYDIHMVDMGPDPRANTIWTAYGCSRGGGDARMFTFSEMDNYHDKEILQEMNSIFRHPITEYGWNVYQEPGLSKSEQRWIESFEDVPVWLAHRYNEDIFAFNRMSHTLWERWIDKEPELFGQSVLRRGILRIYSDKKDYQRSVQRQDRIGATQYLLTPERIASEHLALADAVATGQIVGGIYVVGFTVNVHKFMHQLLDSLVQRGAKCEWMQPVKSILFDSQRNAIGVCGTDKIWEADHYVISPGAFGNTLLAGTRSQDKIHGVIGAWLQLPNIEPQLTHSLKLARKGHINEDANITVATDADGNPILLIGSGYGHTGRDPRNIDGALLEQMYRGVIDTAEKYFPKAYQTARDMGSIEESLKYCVRPWTATGLGLFETLPTSQGGICIITGGHNTGGFAQSPVVAQAVLAAFTGREHSMHSFYHPERGYAFLNPVGYAESTGS